MAHVCENGRNAQTVEKEMDLKEKSLGLEGLMARVNTSDAGRIEDDPWKKMKMEDRSRGVKRFELSITLKSILSLIQKVLKGKK